MNSTTRSRLLRGGVALLVGLAEPALEVAWKCRAGYEISEACVWGRSLMPLGRIIGLVLIAPLVYGALTLCMHAWRAWRSRADA